MDKFNLSTWNVQRKGSPKEVDSVISKTSVTKSEPIPPDIICVQQANLPSTGEECQNYRWLCLGEFGSAVLVNKASALTVERFDQVNEQICVADVVTDPGVVVRVISCYIPPATDYHCKYVWSQLIEVLKNIPGSMTYILAGDFNAEIGKEDDQLGIGIGPKLYHNISNENGKMLNKLLLNIHGTIITTFGDNTVKECSSYTYRDGEEKSQRSFIIVPSNRIPFNSKLLMQDSRVLWYAGYKSAVLLKSLRFMMFEKKSSFNKARVIVSSWNVQGTSPSAVDKALNDLDIPVVCVQDLFLTSADDVETSNYTWYTSKKLWGKNVGILIKSGSNISMTDFEVVSENLCTGNVTMDGDVVKVICCSLPSYTDTERFQEATEKLLDMVKNIPKETVGVVVGDFNTHATYPMLTDSLVFDKGDKNALFLQTLMKDGHVDMPYTPESSRSVTQVSEKVKRNSCFLLMTSMCLWKYSHVRAVRWVPFFENAVVTLYLPECDTDLDRFPYTTSNSEQVNQQKEENTGKVERFDGFMYVTRRFCQLKKVVSMNSTHQQVYHFISVESMAKQKPDKFCCKKSDLSDEIVKKYETSPPPLDELLRILGDGFTLYFGFLQESHLPSGCVSVLAESFRYLNRGYLFVECIDVLEENTKEHVKRIVKFRWNGIVIYQHEGGKFINFKRIINKGQSALTSLLGQHCFTVRARSSFYNNGLPPLCQDKDKLNKVLRMVKRSDLPPSPTVQHVRDLILDFFAKKPNYELVFGPYYAHNRYFDAIKKFVLSRSHGLRMYKSREDKESFDHMCVFYNHSPMDIRNVLMSNPDHQDLRFQLIPPCGTEKNYFEWIDQWEEKPIPNEFFQPFEKMVLQESEASTTQCNGGTAVQTNLVEGNETSKKFHSTGFIPKKIRNVGNMQHQITRCVNLMSGNRTAWTTKGKRDWVKQARELSDLPQDVVTKYRETPIPIQDLRRYLSDNFTLYYGFGRESSVVSTSLDILAESFESLDRGGVMVECILILSRGQPHSRIVKFKWNGVCIHQEEGSTFADFKKMNHKGQTALIDKLGEHFYTVIAKISYFNNGLPPTCPDKEKLAEVFRMVNKSELPESSDQVEGIKKFVTEFFSEASDVELVFGPEVTSPESFDVLKKFANDKQLGYRLLKPTVDSSWDSICFFCKPKPLEVRDRLMKISDHQDLKYFLVPPCEFYNKSHQEWIKGWASENYAEEYKLILEKEKTAKPPPAKPPPAEDQTKKDTQNRGPQVKQQKQSDYRKDDSSSQPTRPATTNHKTDRSRRRAETYRERRRLSNIGSAGQNERSLKSTDYSRDSRQQFSTQDVPNQQVWQEGYRTSSLLSQSAGLDHQLQQLEDYYRNSSQHSRPAESSSQLRQVDDYFRDNSNVSRPDDYSSSVWLETKDDKSYKDDYASSNLYGRQDATYSGGKPFYQQQPDYLGETLHPQESRSGAGLKRDWKEMNKYEESSRSQPSTSERYEPEGKRGKVAVSRVERPRWDDVGPLLIVWPVNIRSEQEKNSRKVLEANFPTEISLEANNRVAVHVTLPLRNRRNKKYCLSIDNNVFNATKNALDMIVKRSSIIKYTVTFLPQDGLVPNFIRYNIPCQTNPRTYIMLSLRDTGPLTPATIIELFESFKQSLNEDLFFDKELYDHEMKQMLLDLAPKHGLKVRHFGEDYKLAGRYVCVYKTKPKEEVLEEVLKMRDLHPKYRLVSNKLPPRLGLNIF